MGHRAETRRRFLPGDDTMSEVDFLQVLQTKNMKLPTLPGIASLLIEAVHREDPDIQEISDIIAKDPPLSAEVLRFVNSPYFGLRKKISSVFHASQMLGINTIKNLALSFSLIKSFHGINDFDYSGFWKDSMIAAVSCKTIARRVIPPFSEDAFFLGLLHNIGILVLSEYFPTEYRLVLNEMSDEDANPTPLENQILGFDHMVVGHYLTKEWRLSDHLVLPIRHHHKPEEVENTSEEIVSITRLLHLATQIVAFFKQPKDVVRAGIVQHYIDAYGYNDQIKIEDTLSEVNRQVSDVLPVFDITDFSRDQYQVLIERAREALLSISLDHVQKLIEQQQEIDSLKENVSKDGMTSLLNHRSFHRMLHRELNRNARYGKPISILIADLDDFKKINDTHGHLVGDKVIKLVAGILRSNTRETDMVARYGGEEFGIICIETGIEGALKLADRLRESVSSCKFIHDNANIDLTVSIGLASVEGGERINKDELIHRADQALYRAKKSGKNTCCSHL
jgi:diguanylate cyclase (GGDEF)-like protein